MSKMGSHDPFGDLKHKLWPKRGRESNCQFGIALIFLRASDVQHTIENLSTRAITLLQTSLQLEVCTQSYWPPKSREFQFGEFRLSLGSPRTK